MITWRKSSYSSDSGAPNCVELAQLDAAAVGVRDSKSPDAGHLTLEPKRLAKFVRGAKSGRYDR